MPIRCRLPSATRCSATSSITTCWATRAASALDSCEGAQALAARYDIFTEVLGVGLYVAMIVGRHPRTGEAPPNGWQFGRTLHQVGRRHGLLIRPYPSHILLAPPLTITADEVDDLLARLDSTR